VGSLLLLLDPGYQGLCRQHPTGGTTHEGKQAHQDDGTKRNRDRAGQAHRSQTGLTRATVATKLKRRASSKTGMSDGHGMSVLSYPDAAAGCSARRRPTIWSTKLFLPGDVRPFFR
jgi:hypothetical protein